MVCEGKVGMEMRYGGGWVGGWVLLLLKCRCVEPLNR